MGFCQLVDWLIRELVNSLKSLKSLKSFKSFIRVTAHRLPLTADCLLVLSGVEGLLAVSCQLPAVFYPLPYAPCTVIGTC